MVRVRLAIPMAPAGLTRATSSGPGLTAFRQPVCYRHVTNPQPTDELAYAASCLGRLGILAAIAAVALWRRRELKHYLWSV